LPSYVFACRSLAGGVYGLSGWHPYVRRGVVFFVPARLVGIMLTDSDPS
jgi:hypothetical protein